MKRICLEDLCAFVDFPILQSALFVLTVPSVKRLYVTSSWRRKEEETALK